MINKPQSSTVKMTARQKLPRNKVPLPAAKPKGVTIRTAKRLGRNAKCHCGSGKKFKVCCGKPVMKPLATQVPYSDIRSFYTPEQIAAQQAFVMRWGFDPDPSQLKLFMFGTEEEQVDMICALLASRRATPAFIALVRESQCMLTRRNQAMWPAEIAEAYITKMQALQVIVTPEEKADDPRPAETPGVQISEPPAG